MTDPDYALDSAKDVHNLAQELKEPNPKHKTTHNLSALSLNELVARVIKQASPNKCWFGSGNGVFDKHAMASQRLALFKGLAKLGLKAQFITALHKVIGDENIPTQVDTYWVCLTATGEQLGKAFEAIRPEVIATLEKGGG